MMPRSSRGRDEAPRAGLWASSRRRHTHALMGESQRSMKQVKGAIAVQWITARALTKALTSNAEKEEETFRRRGRYLINMKRGISDKRAHLLLYFGFVLSGFYTVCEKPQIWWFPHENVYSTLWCCSVIISDWKMFHFDLFNSSGMVQNLTDFCATCYVNTKTCAMFC